MAETSFATTAQLGISAQQREVIAACLATRLPGDRVMGFGSRVSGWPFGRGPKPYSDLDVAVWSTRPQLDLALAELRADFEDSPLPWRVDVSLARDLPAPLLAMVEAHGAEMQRATASMKSTGDEKIGVGVHGISLCKLG